MVIIILGVGGAGMEKDERNYFTDLSQAYISSWLRELLNRRRKRSEAGCFFFYFQSIKLAFRIHLS
ncbi:hypothetical protein QY97_01346 [Bacillus thermotolerans]|uniref:Uncharacterized protein n=1 Tax=Bacillus thermotolerans TaxID=1221996 RepID=A0A0F5HQC5_BACTR|nr:hypothetical protein QY95_03407 [Bacillus thermotolerans]KKB36078.1 hypothetical protein QY97_01346 [Bacillus thermotolerans]